MFPQKNKNQSSYEYDGPVKIRSISKKLISIPATMMNDGDEG